MPSATLQCRVVTPDRELLSTEAEFVALPAHDGEMGFRKDRAPLICRLGTGLLRIESGETKHRFFLEGGFAEMAHNTLTVLTRSAQPAGEITAEVAQAAYAEARAMPGETPEARRQRDEALARARAQARIAQTNP